MGWLQNEIGLEKNAANYVPLTPLSHLRRAYTVFPNRTAIVYGDYRKTYTEYYERCTRLASALQKLGIKPGDVVATIIPNLPAQAEAHFGVPACGAILNTINVRLDVSTITYILSHGEAKVILVDTQFLELTEAACENLQGDKPLIIEVPDAYAGYPASDKYLTYQRLLNTGDPTFNWIMPLDEWESLALNYTSGTTGKPKGVVSHHRGSYLMTMGTVISWRMTLNPVFMSIVPLFHCNGWNHIWMMPLLGGTFVCCRDILASSIYNAIADEGVQYFGGAPIVLNMIVNAKPEERREFNHTVEVFTAGAPPAPATLAKIEPLGFNITQVYGLTETYGHITECIWKEDDWDKLPNEKRVEIKARQGVAFPMMEHITVMDKEMHQVPMDGETQGEIMIRGNCVMKGYLKNTEATDESFFGGYFHSGDIAVQHPDGYMQIADRAKDIIISGGENISSVEVEGILMEHPSVYLCAVIAKSDNKWGEVPCAFIELLEGHAPTEDEIIKFARSKLAGFKCPKRVIFQNLPKTSTGKIQKFELRQAAKNLD